jgi:hypothetical protein
MALIGDCSAQLVQWMADRGYAAETMDGAPVREVRQDWTSNVLFRPTD